MSDQPVFSQFLASVWAAAGGPADAVAGVAADGIGALPSVFAVTDLAAATVAAAGTAIAELFATAGGPMAQVRVDRRLASWWFSKSIRPMGWNLPPAWDAIAGDYATADGWIRLHTNAPHHRAAALSVLGTEADTAAVAAAVAHWRADMLEAAVVAAGGCAAAMRSQAQWAVHPQGVAVAAEPLLALTLGDAAPPLAPPRAKARPLSGIRVLDLTRILAGPVATRFLAGFGADVLRIDPMHWDEPSVAPEMTLGKRCARLDLKDPGQLAVLERLLADADVIVHGYRSDALERLGLSAARRRALNPGLVDVCLDAYGWTGPWNRRRGFDSLVQMSTGLAEAGMQILGRDRPTPLPVQALDHAAGYILATAAVRGLTRRVTEGVGSTARTSLARVAQLLMAAGTGSADPALPTEAEADQGPEVEETVWGPARRLLPPLAISGTPLHWSLAAGPLGGAAAEWSPRTP